MQELKGKITSEFVRPLEVPDHSFSTVFRHDLSCPLRQARQRNTKIYFLGQRTTWWGGGLPREGVGVEKFIPSLESLFPPLETQGKQILSPVCFGNVRGCPLDPWGCAKRFVLIVRPLLSIMCRAISEFQPILMKTQWKGREHGKTEACGTLVVTCFSLTHNLCHLHRPPLPPSLYPLFPCFALHAIPSHTRAAPTLFDHLFPHLQIHPSQPLGLAEKCQAVFNQITCNPVKILFSSGLDPFRIG